MPLSIHRRRRSASVALLVISFAVGADRAFAESPLHERIDRLLAAAPDFSKKAAPRCSDEEFLRRLYLDLTGCIPTGAEARAFLADKDPDKRTKLLDRLLAGPEHARQLATVFDVILMERRPEKYVIGGIWREFLRTSFAADKPWDQLVREILVADGTDPKNRAPARFYLDREAEPNLVTRDLSRLFLGRNLQCAQCHDHPLVNDYKQQEYYGLFSFLNRTYLFNDPTLKLMVLAEKGEGEVTYQSVFDPAKATRSARPQALGRAAVKEPMLEKGAEYKVKPEKNVRPVPAFSRLAQLSGELARPDNPTLARNLANRLWALMLGRGIVHPLDMDHGGNPPSNPELLQLLTDEVIARKFQVRGLLREIALTDAYQRSSALPTGMPQADASFAVAQLKPLPPEALGLSLLQATGVTDVERAALGKAVTEATLYPRLAKQVAPLVAAFSGTAGREEEFLPTLDQTLFLSNGPTLRAWLEPKAGNLLDRVGKLTDSNAIAEEVYLSILTRLPTAEERKDLAEYLGAPGRDRGKALKEYAWALLTSAEFRFNH
jgi:hypothetical protein